MHLEAFWGDSQGLGRCLVGAALAVESQTRKARRVVVTPAVAEGKDEELQEAPGRRERATPAILARLTALQGAHLVATATASGSSSSGPLSAPQVTSCMPDFRELVSRKF
jgi:hypothetical protein